jgi:pre-mRNA-splicing factor ATP-dependent RNA helicase DHX38/PRP16
MSRVSSEDGSVEKSKRDEFVHRVAIKLSRSLNTLNPNDGLAKAVIGFVENSRDDYAKFKTGEHLALCLTSSVYSLTLSSGATTFGKFQESFLHEIFSEIQSFLQQEKANHFVEAPRGIDVMESDILAPDPVRQGGLVRPDLVCGRSMNLKLPTSTTHTDHFLPIATYFQAS